MTAGENIRLTKMEESVEEIKTDISVIKSALIGNELSNDKGLIGNVNTLQLEIDSLKDDVRILQNEKIRNAVYIKQLTYAIGALATAVIAELINKML